MKNIFRIFLLAILVPFLAPQATAQNVNALISSGDKALGGYDFEAARDNYTHALERTQDSTERIILQEKLTWCENGINMLRFASRPQVLSSITVPRERFFLYYSHFPDKSWKKGPEGSAFPYNDAADKVIIPLKGDLDTYDLFCSVRDKDGNWGPLLNMGSGINSPEDEIYPVMSEDGKKVWFSSKGLYGVGGYDIFVSEWDEQRQEWGVAENLGFPYSSPYDDMLFCNTPDGNFSLFASNRNCSQDSMVIYLLKYDPTPVKVAVESVEDARRIAALRPRPAVNLDIDESQFSHTMYGDDSFARYFALVGRYSAVKDSIKTLQNQIAGNRAQYAESDEEDRKFIESVIRAAESDIFGLQGRLADISSEIQEVEMEFLLRGETVDPEAFEQSELEATIASATTSGSAPQYTFIQRTLGPAPNFDFALPQKEEDDDMAFAVKEESTLIHGYELPDGLLYQIQLLSSSTPLPDSKMKGLSPVFEKKFTRNYVYRVGWFETWDEANKALPIVKKKGFNAATIVAFDKKTNVSIKDAKSIEAKRKDSVKYRLVFREYPDGLPANVLKAVREGSPVDIARGSEEGRTIYFVAPLDKSAAEKLRNAVIAAGADGVSIEKLQQQ